MKTLKQFTENKALNLAEELGPRVGPNVRTAAHKLWGSLSANPTSEAAIIKEFKKELKKLGFKGKI